MSAAPADALFRQALQAHQAGRLPEAEKLYRQILAAGPHAGALHGLGVMGLQTGRPDQAGPLLAQAAQLDPKNGQYQANLGAALAAVGRLAEAEGVLRKAVELAPRAVDGALNLGMVLLQGGKPAEAVPVLAKAHRLDAGHPGVLAAYGAALARSGELDQAGKILRRAVAKSPRDPNLRINLGNVLLEQGKADEAERELREALALAPGAPQGWFNLGNALRQLNRPQEAAECFTKAVELAPGFPDARINLANSLKTLGRFAEAAEQYGVVLKQRPDQPELHYKRGVCLRKLSRLDEAEADFLAAQALERTAATAFDLGLTQLRLGRGDEARENFRMARLLAPDAEAAGDGVMHWYGPLLARDFAEGWPLLASRKARWPKDLQTRFPQPDWDGSDLGCRSLLVIREQGIGEELSHATLLSELAARAGRVVLLCDDRFVPLFRRSFPALSVHGMADAGHPDVVGADVKAFGADLLPLLRPDAASFGRAAAAILKPDQDQVAALRTRYGEGERRLVGLSWFSRNVDFQNEKSVPLREWAPILRLPGITFVNLQYGDHAAELARVAAELGVEVVQDPAIDPLHDLDGFAAQVAAMDQVVTISNATAHFAGALGKPAAVLLDVAPIWHWGLTETTSLFYPSLSLLRQQKAGEWDAVIRQAADWLSRQA